MYNIARITDILMLDIFALKNTNIIIIIIIISVLVVVVYINR